MLSDLEKDFIRLAVATMSKEQIIAKIGGKNKKKCKNIETFIDTECVIPEKPKDTKSQFEKLLGQRDGITVLTEGAEQYAELVKPKTGEYRYKDAITKFKNK